MLGRGPLLTRAAGAFVGVIALTALWTTGAAFRFVGEAFTGRPWSRWPGPVLAIAVAGALWGVAPRARSRWLAAAAAVVLLVTRVVFVLAHDAPLVSDFAMYHELAQSAPASWESGLPVGYPLLLAAAYRVAGPHLWVAEGLNVVLALATGGVLYGFVRRLWGDHAAALALALYAMWPAQLLMTSVVATETPYALLFLGAIWATFEGGRARSAGADGQRTRGRWWPAAVAGGVLALSQYVRSTSHLLLPVFLLLPLLMGLGWRRAAARALPFTLAFVIALTPVVWHNAGEGRASVATSSFGGWSLLVGANQEHDGVWNADDAALVEGGRTPRERDDLAARLARRRILSDPGGYLGLLVRKFPATWNSESYGEYWAMGTRPDPPLRAQSAWFLASQLFYAGVLLLSCLGTARRPASIALVALVAAVSAIHVVAEVQGRYHYAVVPLFLVLAAGALDRLTDRPLELEVAPEAARAASRIAVTS